MASAGSLIFELAADVSRLRTDMQKAQQEMNASLSSIAKSTAASALMMGAQFAQNFARAFADSIKNAIDQADAMGKMAQRVGVSTEAMSALAYQAKQADASTEDVAAAFRNMQKAVIDAQKSTSDQAAAFKAIGVNINELKKLDAVEQFRTISEAMAGIKDSADKTAVGIALMGKGYQAVAPMMAQGAAGFADARKELEELGGVVRDNTAKAADDFNTQLTKLATVGSSLWMQIAEQLLPTVKDLAKYFIDAANDGNTFAGVLNAVAIAGSYAAQVLIGTSAIVTATAKAFQILNEGYKAPVGDIEAQNKARERMNSLTEDMRRGIDRAADAQARLAKAREQIGKAPPLTSATENHQLDQAGKRSIDFAGALDAAAKSGAKAKDKISDYQKMVEKLNDEYRKAAAEGDPMKELVADPKFMAMSRQQQDSLVALTKRNVDLTRAIAARTQEQENANEEDARQYQQNVARWKAEEDHAADVAKWYEQQRRAADPMIDYNEQVDMLNDALKEGLIPSNEEYLAILKQINDQYDRNVDGGDPYLDQLKQITDAIDAFGKSTADTFVDFISGTSDVATSFREMVASMLKDIAKMLVYQNVFKPMFSAISSGVSGFDWGSLFAGGRMGGGPVSAGRMYEVNELPGRREYFIPNVPGKIVTDAGAGGVGGGTNVTVNVHMTRDDRATQDTTASDRQTAELGNRIATVVRSVISQEKRTGGLLSPTR